MGIQIHELTALNRAPQTGDVLAVDTGTTTNKVDYSALRGAVLTDAVRTDDDQNLTDPQKAQAIENIGAATQADVTAIEDEIGDTTLPTTAQTITGAIAEHETDISDVKTTLSGTVKFNVDQSIGSANKARARNNIGAASVPAYLARSPWFSYCRASLAFVSSAILFCSSLSSSSNVSYTVFTSFSAFSLAFSAFMRMEICFSSWTLSNSAVTPCQVNKRSTLCEIPY